MIQVDLHKTNLILIFIDWIPTLCMLQFDIILHQILTRKEIAKTFKLHLLRFCLFLLILKRYMPVSNPEPAYQDYKHFFSQIDQ